MTRRKEPRATTGGGHDQIGQDVRYALEALVGDAVDHERAKNDAALSAAKSDAARAMAAKTHMLRRVVVGAVSAVILIGGVMGGGLWLWFGAHPSPAVDTLTATLQHTIRAEIAQSQKPVVQWASLPDVDKDALRIEAYARFPEILAHNKRGKYYSVNTWLLEEKRVLHPFVRDIFRRDIGKVTHWNGRAYKLPGVYTTLIEEAPKIKAYLDSRATPPNDVEVWLAQVKRHADFTTVEDGTPAYVLIEARFTASSRP